MATAIMALDLLDLPTVLLFAEEGIRPLSEEFKCDKALILSDMVRAEQVNRELVRVENNTRDSRSMNAFDHFHADEAQKYARLPTEVRRDHGNFSVLESRPATVWVYKLIRSLWNEYGLPNTAVLEWTVIDLVKWATLCRVSLAAREEVLDCPIAPEFLSAIVSNAYSSRFHHPLPLFEELARDCRDENRRREWSSYPSMGQYHSTYAMGQPFNPTPHNPHWSGTSATWQYTHEAPSTTSSSFRSPSAEAGLGHSSGTVGPYHGARNSKRNNYEARGGNNFVGSSKTTSFAHDATPPNHLKRSHGSDGQPQSHPRIFQSHEPQQEARQTSVVRTDLISFSSDPSSHAPNTRVTTFQNSKLHEKVTGDEPSDLETTSTARTGLEPHWRAAKKSFLPIADTNASLESQLEARIELQQKLQTMLQRFNIRHPLEIPHDQRKLFQQYLAELDDNAEHIKLIHGKIQAHFSTDKHSPAAGVSSFRDRSPVTSSTASHRSRTSTHTQQYTFSHDVQFDPTSADFNRSSSPYLNPLDPVDAAATRMDEDEMDNRENHSAHSKHAPAHRSTLTSQMVDSWMSTPSSSSIQQLQHQQSFEYSSAALDPTVRDSTCGSLEVKPTDASSSHLSESQADSSTFNSVTSSPEVIRAEDEMWFEVYTEYDSRMEADVHFSKSMKKMEREEDYDDDDEGEYEGECTEDEEDEDSQCAMDEDCEESYDTIEDDSACEKPTNDAIQTQSLQSAREGRGAIRPSSVPIPPHSSLGVEFSLREPSSMTEEEEEEEEAEEEEEYEEEANKRKRHSHAGRTLPAELSAHSLRRRRRTGKELHALAHEQREEHCLKIDGFAEELSASFFEESCDSQELSMDSTMSITPSQSSQVSSSSSSTKRTCVTSDLRGSWTNGRFQYPPSP